jgi:hypothetical protein
MKRALLVFCVLIVCLPVWGVYHKIGEYITQSAETVAVNGSIAYIGQTGGGFQIVDVSDLQNPQLLGFYDANGDVFNMVSVGDTLYVVGAFGLQVVNVSDPGNPQLLGSYTTPNCAEKIILGGTTAYIACRDSGLLVIDVSDPQNLGLSGYVSVDYASDVAISDTTVYIEGSSAVHSSPGADATLAHSERG